MRWLPAKEEEKEEDERTGLSVVVSLATTPSTKAEADREPAVARRGRTRISVKEFLYVLSRRASAFAGETVEVPSSPSRSPSGSPPASRSVSATPSASRAASCAGAQPSALLPLASPTPRLCCSRFRSRSRTSGRRHAAALLTPDLVPPASRTTRRGGSRHSASPRTGDADCWDEVKQGRDFGSGANRLRPPLDELKKQPLARDTAAPASLKQGAEPAGGAAAAAGEGHLEARECLQEGRPSQHKRRAEEFIRSGPPNFDPRVDVLGDLCGDFNRAGFDPARREGAKQVVRKVATKISIDDLRFSHDTVSPTFRNGHAGKHLVTLLQELRDGIQTVEQVPALVVARHRGNDLVVSGNRRLKVFKCLRDLRGTPFDVQCELYDLQQENVPPPVLAKLFSSLTTRNGGRDAQVRPCRWRSGGC